MKTYWKCENLKSGNFRGGYGILSKEDDSLDKCAILFRTDDPEWTYHQQYIPETSAMSWLDSDGMEKPIELTRKEVEDMLFLLKL